MSFKDQAGSVAVGEDTPLVRIWPDEPNKRPDNHHDENRSVFATVFLLVLAACFVLAASFHVVHRSDPSSSVTQPMALLMALIVQVPPPSYPVVKRGDFGAYKEYSVIHSDRSLNLMSEPFQEVMRDLNLLLKTTYNADKVAIIPGSGTFGMEAVARQFATDEHVLVLRNGYFSYRWTDIFEFGTNDERLHVDRGGPGKGIPVSHTVLRAQPTNDSSLHPQYKPYPVDAVVQRIQQERPSAVFLPHVETSTGIMVSDEYIQEVASAVHTVDGLVIVDGIASGSLWLDMKDLGIDVLISAPQKSWTSPPCAALVMLSQRALGVMATKPETSFSMSLKKWLAAMDAYEQGGYAYHTTPPTDALREFQQVSVEMLAFGLDKCQQKQQEMGRNARALLESNGLVSVAAPGYEAPGVLVFYSPPGVMNPEMVDLFHQRGLQIAPGVPSWMLGEPEGLETFRVGLFGLDKLQHVSRTLATLEEALSHVLAKCIMD